jgi:ornithine cyclodeaminase/alanine dehydrogenase-like protein (mu-crystallin family)
LSSEEPDSLAEPVEPVEKPLELRFLSKEEFDELDLAHDRVVEEIERGLRAHGNDEVVMPPKTTSSSSRATRATTTSSKATWPRSTSPASKSSGITTTTTSGTSPRNWRF